MFFITKENSADLLLGSIFLATGGGLPPQEHAKIFNQCFERNQQLSVKTIDEFDSEDCLATIYGVGDPSKAVDTDTEELVRRSVKEYERLAELNIKGIIPGEIGAEGLAFQAAAYLELPVVDSDLVGGRAAPEIQMDCFSVWNLPITPIMSIALNGKLLFLQGDFSSNEVEEITRLFLTKNGGTGILIGYPIKAGIYAKKGMQGTLSRAQAVGALLAKKDIASVLKLTEGNIVATEKLLAVDLASKDGFFQGFLTLGKYRIRVKNEHIFLVKGEQIVAQAPDLLVLLTQDCTPIHNADIGMYVGQNISIIHIPAQGYWKEEKNKLLWKSAME